MARRELQISLQEAQPQRPTSREGWDSLYRSPEFLQCLWEIKAEYLKALRNLPHRDERMNTTEAWRAEGLKDALRRIEFAEQKSIGADNAKAPAKET